ncbi:MAG: response regulator [Rhodospirillaceae bacterium]|jgi:two-component system, chemotaxis family, chemotaxis protein CheY|nr:response regulator [Rhodospirillaceae bacterium]MBT6139450.1 response regulator [Rhodospirillaceae bacterium]
MKVEDVKVLIIEDESYSRAIIRQVLTGLGFVKIHEAEEGGEGFKKTLQVRPNLVLCDIHMQPVDGMKYLTEIRSVRGEGISSTPVIFLTSNANERTVKLARDLHVDGYLVKPVSANEVKKQIGYVLSIIFPR